MIVMITILVVILILVVITIVIIIVIVAIVEIVVMILTIVIIVRLPSWDGVLLEQGKMNGSTQLPLNCPFPFPLDSPL